MHELVIIETGHIDARFKHSVYLFHLCQMKDICEICCETALEGSSFGFVQDAVYQSIFLELLRKLRYAKCPWLKERYCQYLSCSFSY